MQTDKKEVVFKERPNKSIVLNSKVKDSSSKIIFDDSTLCAQFMQDYVERLKGIEIRPENIEDVSNRYVPLIAEERNSDTVKRVIIPDKAPFYFISLIEHKTQVDYNIGMQIFRYIYQIWEDYEKTMEFRSKGVSKTKSFQYPPVIPIVYYEGDDEWTAPMEFKEKINMHEMFGDMIPNFSYQLVSLKRYSNQELLDKGDAISLMMLIHKIRDRESINQFVKDADERLLDIIRTMPDNLVKKIVSILRVCLYSLNVQEDEVEQIVSKVEEKKMGRLFEGVTFDMQAEREEVQAEREEVQAEREEVQAEREEVQAEREEVQAEREEVQTEREEVQTEREEVQTERQVVQAESQTLQVEKETLWRAQEEFRAEQIAFYEMRDNMCAAYVHRMSAEGKSQEQILEGLQNVMMLDEDEAREKLKLFGDDKA